MHQPHTDSRLEEKTGNQLGFLVRLSRFGRLRLKHRRADVITPREEMSNSQPMSEASLSKNAIQLSEACVNNV